jgi:hypothetical protein
MKHPTLFTILCAMGGLATSLQAGDQTGSTPAVSAEAASSAGLQLRFPEDLKIPSRTVVNLAPLKQSLRGGPGSAPVAMAATNLALDLTLPEAGRVPSKAGTRANSPSDAAIMAALGVPSASGSGAEFVRKCLAAFGPITASLPAGLDAAGGVRECLILGYDDERQTVMLVGPWGNRFELAYPILDQVQMTGFGKPDADTAIKNSALKQAKDAANGAPVVAAPPTADLNGPHRVGRGETWPFTISNLNNVAEWAWTISRSADGKWDDTKDVSPSMPGGKLASPGAMHGIAQTGNYTFSQGTGVYLVQVHLKGNDGQSGVVSLSVLVFDASKEGPADDVWADRTTIYDGESANVTARFSATAANPFVQAGFTSTLTDVNDSTVEPPTIVAGGPGEDKKPVGTGVVLKYVYSPSVPGRADFGNAYTLHLQAAEKGLSDTKAATDSKFWDDNSSPSAIALLYIVAQPATAGKAAAQ